MRVATDLVAGAVCQLNYVERFGDSRLRVIAVERRYEAQVSHAVEVGVEARRFDETGHVGKSIDRLLRVMAEYARLTGGWRDQPEHHP